MNGCTYAACTYALTINLPQVQSRAVQCLCGVFVGYPRLMLQAQDSGLMRKLLCGEYSDCVRERMLVSLRDMMLSEEVRKHHRV